MHLKGGSFLQYNDTINKFIEKNIGNTCIDNINEEICYNKRELNQIISRYGMYKNKMWKSLCIDSIIGKDRGKTQSLLMELNDLFDENGEAYKKRSISMLKYNSKEIILKLENSLEDEPIELKEIKSGKYIISNNGMHRINLLKVHYRKELNNNVSTKDLTKLHEKYTIKAMVEEIDIIKTYSRYLLSLYDKNIAIEDEINDKYQKTENVIIYDENEHYKIMNYNDLIAFVKERIKKILKNGYDKELLDLYKTDEYFKEYIDLYLKEKFN